MFLQKLLTKIKCIFILFTLFSSINPTLGFTQELVVNTHKSQGTLVIIGGGLRIDNAEVWQRIVNLSGGHGAKIAVLALASNNPEESGNNIIRKLNKYGADAFFIPISTDAEVNDADDQELALKIKNATGIYFAGGDQARITKALLRNDGSRTAALESVWEVYNRGGVIAGSSAGAAIMSSTMFDNAKSVINMLKMGVHEGDEIAPGLGFIGNDVFIDQHLLVRGRFARMILAMDKMKYRHGLGVDENTAMVISANRDVEIIGYSGAIFIDLSQAKKDPNIKHFNISNASISYLDHGDKFNLSTQEFIPSADKIHNKVTQSKHEKTSKIFVNNILANSAVQVLMENLIDSPYNEAIGIAFGNPNDPLPQLGFRFSFSKKESSVGYASSDVNAHTIINLNLNIQPFKSLQPIYPYDE